MMGKIAVTKTELIWPGKYNEDGAHTETLRVRLPFHISECLSAGKAGEAGKDGWRNKLIWGDNLLVMGSLLEQFAGKIDLIYIDPPFATGADFSFKTQIGDGDLEVSKEQSIIEEKAYRDTWGRGLDSFIHMLSDRFHLMRDLLADDGSIYIHIGWNVSHYVKAALDDVFGSDRFVNQIIWKRQTAHSDARQGSQHFGRIHDCILLYSKTDFHMWNQLHTPHDAQYLKTHYKNVEPETGRRYELADITAPGGAAKGNPYYEFLGVTKYWRYSKRRIQQLYEEGRIVQPSPGAVPRYKRYLDEMPGLPVQDVWLDLNAINSQA